MIFRKFKDLKAALKGKEKYLFIVFLILNLLPFYFTQYIGSLDGPKHLQIANIMVELWKGNELFQSYFEFSAPYVGNVSGHYLLAIFRLFLPAWMSEKLVLSLYVILLATGFRYLVKGVSKTINYSYFLIFPFTYTFLFMMGFYNYSLAFGFMFFALGYFVRHHTNLNWKKNLILSFLVLLTYYSHIFVYGFLLFSLGILYIKNQLVSQTENASFKFKSVASDFLRLFLAVLPSLILAGFYVNLILQYPTGDSEGILIERWEFLKQMKILVGFIGVYEIPYTSMIFWLIMGLLGLNIGLILLKVNRFKKYRNDHNFQNDIVWGVIVVVLFSLYFLMPNNLNAAGNVLNRLLIIALYFLIVWLSIRKIPQILNIFILLFLLFYGISLYGRQIEQRQHYDEIIKEIKQVESNLPENCTFLSKNYYKGWVSYHFQTYIGTGKPIVNVYSQAISPLFAVKWSENRPLTYVGCEFAHDYTAVFTATSATKTMNTEFITVVGKDDFFNESEGNPLMQVIDLYYTERQDLSNDLVVVYELNIQDKVDSIKSIISEDVEVVKDLELKSSELGVPLEELITRQALYHFKTINDSQ